MVECFYMTTAKSAFDAPEPMGALGIKRAGSETERAPEPIRVGVGEGQKDRGREIASEAMKGDKRIWMRRSSGALEQVFVIGVDDEDAECCWVQSDGAVLVKHRSLAEVAQDQDAAAAEGVAGQSERADAYKFVWNLRNARQEKMSRGSGRDRVEPLHVFDGKTRKFVQINTDHGGTVMSSGAPEDFTPKNLGPGENPFEKVMVEISDPESHEDRAIWVTPTQFMRDQIAYFLNEKRRHPLGKEEGMKEYIRKARELAAKDEDEQHQQQQEFSDIIKRESGYSQRATVRDLYVSVAYIKHDRSYEMYMNYADGSRKKTPEFYRPDLRINEDWGLSKKDAESVFLFAKAQLDAGEDLVSAYRKVEAFVAGLKKGS